MKKILSIFFLLFPVLALAADGSGSLSFTPPQSDYSIVFLENLFGNVGGVIHGSGGQIIGAMFSVFNSAVLALGGILIMYILIVSTMNTAHEGQVLGQKWSSIWIPIRSTVGLALLIPKSSGYCLMQVFVMWIVVQGVGAADKIWDAALDYLNKGGVIIKAEVGNPLSGDQKDMVPLPVANGAAVILQGQVCMLGLQTALEQQRKNYLNLKEKKAGPCYGNPTGDMKNFCDTAVPDFLSTVNAVTVMDRPKLPQTGAYDRSKTVSYQVSMPNFTADSAYSFLNGICGTIRWSGFSDDEVGNMSVSAGTSNLKAIQVSRAIGIQAMYTTLQDVARVMVNNDPKLQDNPQEEPAANYSSVAEYQFGIPYTLDGFECTSSAGSGGDGCVSWGSSYTSHENDRLLFNGGEFMGAIRDYNGIMRPAMNLLNQYKSNNNDKDAKAFIKLAEAQGWMMAGSYFFDLVRLNGSAAPTEDDFDRNSNLQQSNFDISSLSEAFGSSGQCQGIYSTLCYWFNKSPYKVNNLVALINGNGIANMTDSGGNVVTSISLPDFSSTTITPFKTVGGLASSTVNGYITNAAAMRTPGQPGLTNTAFALPNNMKVTIDTGRMRLPKIHFNCGRIWMLGCFGKFLGKLFYNIIFKTIYNFLLDTFSDMIDSIVMGFLAVPIQGMMTIFNSGLKILEVPGINPVIALANMGIAYINFSANLWIMLMFQAISAAILPLIGVFVFALLAMGLPLLISWTGVMMAIGFSTAYYVPLLPYMLFLFGVMAWLMAVVEAMVAGPIVALGVTHPEGHEAFGKGESAVMILLNVFLRPSMMIIGYIVGIALSYITVWMLNAGFGHAISFMTNDLGTTGGNKMTFRYDVKAGDISAKDLPGTDISAPDSASYSIQYSDWAGIYAYFFSVLLYTSFYLLMVQKSFTLIANLPDRVLRWLGSQAESYGGETTQWGEEAKQRVDKGGEAAAQDQSQMQKQVAGYTEKAITAAKDKLSSGSDKQDKFGVD